MWSGVVPGSVVNHAPCSIRRIHESTNQRFRIMDTILIGPLLIGFFKAQRIVLKSTDPKMVIDDTKIAVVQPSTGKGGSIMKKKRKMHIGTDKSQRKASKYSTETVSLIGLVLVALLNLHLHYNVSNFELLL